MEQDSIEELNGSQLGTKEYWDKSYVSEIKNYKSHGDVGEIWFDEDSQIRVINWMLKNNISADSRIIDLGNFSFIWQELSFMILNINEPTNSCNLRQVAATV